MTKELSKRHPIRKTLIGLVLTGLAAVGIIRYQQTH